MGGVLCDRAGNKNCLLLTLGHVLVKYGYPASAYLAAALREFDRTDVIDRPEYMVYAALLRGRDFLLLHMLVHMGLPEGVALAIVHRSTDSTAKLAIFTCGKPVVVEFAIIAGNHIMPMVCTGSPFSSLPWTDFAESLKDFQAQGGEVMFKHTSRSLPPMREEGGHLTISSSRRAEAVLFGIQRGFTRTRCFASAATRNGSTSSERTTRGPSADDGCAAGVGSRHTARQRR